MGRQTHLHSLQILRMDVKVCLLDVKVCLLDVKVCLLDVNCTGEMKMWPINKGAAFA